MHFLSNIGFPLTLVLAIPLGIAAAFGAIIFRKMIGFFHNLFFLNIFSFQFDPLKFTQENHLGILIIFIPAILSIVVTFLIQNFAHEAKGHGVPEVLDAVYNKSSHIRPRVSLIKSLASSITIGSGGSVGREGPIIQIGAAIGSFFGKMFTFHDWQKTTLVAAGAGAGIAATFNTPIGGILFATELILSEISMRTIVPVICATTISTYIARLFMGANTAFSLPIIEHYELTQYDHTYLIYLSILGMIIGMAAFLFSRSIYFFEDQFEKVFSNAYIRHCTGMLGVGCIIWLTYHFAGHYYIEGVGYATIQSILNHPEKNLILLAWLFILKFIVTGITLGSGGSGGVFSPSLFIGATLGCFIGNIVHSIFPGFPLSVPLFAVVAMAGMVAGTTHAVITAIVMIIEMTSTYHVAIEIICVAGIAASTSFMISNKSIYTLKLARRGTYIPIFKIAHHSANKTDIIEPK